MPAGLSVLRETATDFEFRTLITRAETEERPLREFFIFFILLRTAHMNKQERSVTAPRKPLRMAGSDAFPEGSPRNWTRLSCTRDPAGFLESGSLQRRIFP